MGGPAQNPWASSVARSIVALGLIPPIDPKKAGGVFSLADPDDLRALLRRAGFDGVQIEEMEFHLRFSDFEDYWSFVQEFAGAVAILLRSFSDEERAAVRGGNGASNGGVSNGSGLRSPRSVCQCDCVLTIAPMNRSTQGPAGPTIVLFSRT
jgi:hypothetical protein